MRHNNSHITTLSLLELTDGQIKTYSEHLFNNVYYESGPIQDSPCMFTNTENGRVQLAYISGRTKYFGYHISAFMKFGREQMSCVNASKGSKHDLVVSHICGNGPRCCNPDHLCLDTKNDNEERTHCHFAYKQWLKFLSVDDPELHRLLAVTCPHNPRCCVEYKIK